MGLRIALNRIVELEAELDAISEIADAKQNDQVRDEQPPIDHPAKKHAMAILQKLEAGEAIVLGDLQSRLRAFVDAL
ncbi:MAG: hypothetical protein GAK33_07896 [Burkholderia lata]|uniref:Uncharacterized protein n=2 Tax=Burkholderia lata (strain ATCC 17760 / DSM 23089 / LMG 22485 / NCIMB 9086 / R18194 / 383) TaxID=482957 RepID=A0A833PIB8_BURL3|nr:MAG: hypothetical protein GAK33_07896 [Burkholderia lata]